ncbi:hypothetical protein ACFFWC_26320 [Plantactinospora siamensis]|uniref:Galactose oxidase n=1 Tax=Plantactinospora siamensis TaxID=555372 RepID=A0ABV6P0U4_9ACTN
MVRGARVLAAGMAAAVLLAGCPARRAAPAVPASLDWRAVELPAPPGPPGAALPRDVVACAGTWFLVGGLRDAAGQTRPAAWVSRDGAAWSALPVAGRSFYGRQNVLYAAGCRDGRLAAVGAKNGGAHGNPRTSLWRQSGTGLVEVAAPTDATGAPDAVSLARIAGGPAGWLVTGDRAGAASVWPSADGSAYRGPVALAAAAAGGRPRAFDAVATGSGWLVVGAVDVPGRLEPAPAVWQGDARGWRTASFDTAAAGGPASGASPADGGAGQAGELHRVVALGDAAVAVGPAESGFGAWRVGPDGAAALGRFGADRAGDSGGAPAVHGLAAAAGRLVAATADSAGYALWISADAGASWRSLAAPAALPPAGGDRRVSVAGAGDRVVVAVDDAGRPGVWWAPLGAG